MRAVVLKDCSQPAQMNQQNPAPQAPASDVRTARAARLEAARAELRAATERGEGGRVALKQYSQRMDAIIQQLFVEAAAGAVQPVGVFALGGYGRRQLCLHSDIDVLILFAGPLWPEDERFLHAFLNPLWDVGLTIGHHVREVAEGAGLDADNPEFQLALTDARAIAGDATLLDSFFDASSGPVAAARTLEALKTLIADRHARFNETFYQLEPDIKEAPGGLRDLFGAQTIAKLTDPALFSRAGGDLRSLDDAEEFLLRVRSVLHLETKRHHDVLSHELQEVAAERLRYPGETTRQRVERLMSEYFRHARAVDRGLRWTLRTAPAPIGPNLVRSTDGIRFVDRRAAAARPETWLPLFQAAIDQGCAVSDEALACVQQNAGRFTAEEFFPNAASRDALLRFLKPRAGSVRAAVRDARLGSARADVSRVQGDQLPRGARLLSQVHRRRAHAADHPQPRAAGGSGAGAAAVRPAARRGRHSRAAGAGAAVSRRRESPTTTTVITSRARAWRARWPSASTSIASRAKRSNS